MSESWISKIRYRQFMYCTFALLTLTSGSIHGTWTSPYIPQLKSDESPISVTINTIQSSLITSSIYIGHLIGGVFSIWGYDLFGRKKILILGGVIDILAWVLIYFAKSVGLLIAGRIIGGLSTVIVLNCAAIYNGEIADNDNRGKLGFMLTIFVTLGLITSYIIGPYLSYGHFAIMAMCLTIVSTVLVFFIPESPYFLIMNKKFKEAEETICKISCDSVDSEFIKNKILEIKNSVENDMKNKSSVKELLTNKVYRKPLFIHWSLKFLVYFSGNTVIKAYMQNIISNTGSTLSSGTSSIIFGIFNILSVFPSSYAVDKFGKKPLLTISTFVCGICNFTLAVYLYLYEKTQYNLDSISWLPLTCLVGFEVFIAIALLPLSYMIGAELYPMNVKGIAVSTVSLSIIPLIFLVQMTFESVSEYWGTFTAIWIFSFFCFLGTIFSIFIFPETKGKNFQEIQKELRLKT